jgi:purine nucleosidase
MIKQCTYLMMVLLTVGFADSFAQKSQRKQLTKVIFDTDANNELDDQHALAYLLFSSDVFDLKGVTVNATHGGGALEKHYDEAKRVLQFAKAENTVPLFRGADQAYATILPQLNDGKYDGADAVEFIIKTAKANKGDKLVIVAVGKLTNVALALKKDPQLSKRIKVVWLGSNYPEPGEYNLNADTVAMNAVLKTDVAFEMVTVRYKKETGSDAVRVLKTDIEKRMPGKGPQLATAIPGRRNNGNSFTNFGDYSIELFKYISYKTTPPSRALFDLVTLSILKQPAWGEKQVINAPLFVNNSWIAQPRTVREVVLWENFKSKEIIDDFFTVMEHYKIKQQ